MYYYWLISMKKLKYLTNTIMNMLVKLQKYFFGGTISHNSTLM